MSDEEKPKRRIKKRWIAIAIVVALPLGLRLAAPYAIASYAVAYLEGQGLTVETRPSVSFGLIRGRAQVENLVAKDATGTPLALGHVHIDLDWNRLFQRQIVFEEVQIGALELAINVDEDDTITISGLPIPPADPDAEPLNLQYEVVKLDVAGSRIGLNIQDFATIIAIDSVGLEYLGNIEPEKSALVNFVVTVDDSPVTFGGDANPFHTTPGTSTDVAIEALDIAPFAPWLIAAGIYEPSGTLSLDLAIDLSFDRESQEIDTVANGSLSVNSFNLNHADAQSPSVTLQWDGLIEAKGPANALQILLDGGLRIEPLNLKLPKNDIAIATQPIDWDGEVRITPASDTPLTVSGALAVAAGALNIYRDDAPQTISFDQLKLDSRPFTLESDGAFAATGKVDLNEGSFLDPGANLDVRSSGLGVEFDLKATSGEPGLLSGGAKVNIAEAAVSTGAGDERLNAAVEGLVLDAQNFETPLGGEAYVRATPTLTIDRASAENAGGFDAVVNAIDYSGELDTGGEVVVSGTAALSEIEFANRAQESMNGTVSSINVTEFSVASDSRVTATTIAIDGVSAYDTLPPLGERQPKSIVVGGLQVSNTDIGSEAFTADAVAISDIAVLLQRRKDGTFALAPPAASGASESSGEATPDAEPALVERSGEEAAKPFRVAVSSFRLDGENSIRFYDGSIDPAANLNIRPVILTLDDLDTADSSGPVKFDLKVGLGEVGKIEANGAMTPDAVTPSGNMTASIQAVDLVPFDTYSQRFIGYRLATGKVDYNADITIDKGEIDATTDVILTNFAMERLSTEEKSELTEQLGVPVNTAISLLRDPDNAIRLKIPITGNLSSPSFGIGDAIRKATVNAMKNSVAAVFKPIGLVLGAAGRSTKFDPVVFANGSSELSPEGIDQLAKVAELLRKRPKVNIRVCGIATRSEKKAAGVIPPLISVDDPDAAILLDPNKPSEPKPATEESMPGDEGLRELATARSQAVRTYLADDQEINRDRLVECAPRIEVEPDAKPRVSIGL